MWWTNIGIFQVFAVKVTHAFIMEPNLDAILHTSVLGVLLRVYCLRACMRAICLGQLNIWVQAFRVIIWGSGNGQSELQSGTLTEILPIAELAHTPIPYNPYWFRPNFKGIIKISYDIIIFLLQSYSPTWWLASIWRRTWSIGRVPASSDVQNLNHITMYILLENVSIRSYFITNLFRKMFHASCTLLATW